MVVSPGEDLFQRQPGQVFLVADAALLGQEAS
jgi:hypothetical protein